MNRRIPPSVRRLVLGGALLLATLVAFVPDPPPVSAAESAAHAPLLLAQSDAKAAAAGARDAVQAADEAANEAAAGAKDAAAGAKEGSRPSRRRNIEVDVDADTPGDGSAGERRKRITIGIDGADRQYDSFEQFVDRDPEMAGAVLGIVFIVFLSPVLVIGLVIWYKLRKNRMQNETMLKLAERGIVPPGEAMRAIGTGRAGDALGVAAASMPLAEHARALRSQAAWSDLRRGVLLGAAGLGFTLFHIFDDGSPSWFGLVLLFVGIGFCVLWYFEDRQVATHAAAHPGNPAPSTSPGDRQS